MQEREEHDVIFNRTQLCIKSIILISCFLLTLIIRQLFIVYPRDVAINKVVVVFKCKLVKKIFEWQLHEKCCCCGGGSCCCCDLLCYAVGFMWRKQYVLFFPVFIFRTNCTSVCLENVPFCLKNKLYMYHVQFTQDIGCIFCVEWYVYQFILQFAQDIVLA